MIAAIVGAVIGSKLGRRMGERLGHAVEAEIARQVAQQRERDWPQQPPTMAASVYYGPGDDYANGDTRPRPELLTPPDWSFVRTLDEP
jgi:hypothetical protein